MSRILGNMGRKNWESLKQDLGISNEPRAKPGDDDFVPKVGYSKIYYDYAALLEQNPNLVSHPQLRKLIAEMLEDYDLYKELYKAFPAATGTGIAYAPPGEPLQQVILRKDIYLEIPKKYQNTKDIALVFPDIKIRRTEGKQFEVLNEEFYVIDGFPARNGWYNVDQKHMIPQGDRLITTGPSSLYLVREEGEYVGPVVGGPNGECEDVTNVVYAKRVKQFGTIVRS